METQSSFENATWDIENTYVRVVGTLSCTFHLSQAQQQ